MVEKYSSLLDFLGLKSVIERSSLDSIFEFTINQINYQYAEEEIQAKCAAVYVVKEINERKNFLEKEGILDILEKFFEYNKEYQNYIDTLAIISDQFHADLCFYKKFIEIYLKD